MLGIKNTKGEGSFRSLPGGKKAPQKRNAHHHRRLWQGRNDPD